MAKQFIKINSAGNEDGNDLFNAICKDVLKQQVNDVRHELGLPIAQKVTTKDVITLIQEKKLNCEIKIIYDDAVVPAASEKKSEDDSNPFA